MYVMTPEFGAASQLEKIDMLDFAEFVAINKFDRKGASDALRDVAKQVQRNKEAWTTPTEDMPVFGTMAARFNDDGVTALYQALKGRLGELGLHLKDGLLPLVKVRFSTNQTPIVPAARTRYLSEISDTVRGYKKRARAQAKLAREIQQLNAAADMLEVAHMAVHAVPMTSRGAMAWAFSSVTVNGALAMGLPDPTLRVGGPATMVVLQARDPIEAVRLKATRLAVIRNGRILAQTAPRVAQLSLPGRPDSLDPASYAPIAED
jgi:hypothetical protein